MDRTINWILIVVALLAVLAGTDLMVFPGSIEAAEIFDWARAILPLLAGLLLGFRFGQISR